MQKLISKSITKKKLKQRLAVHALQKQLQILKLKEYLILISFSIGAALLRVPLQEFPSVEPLTFFAILSGWLFGKNKGFAVGASSLFISNFFMFGGQGPWTPFQLAAFGIAGYLGGFLKEKSNIFHILGITFISTIAFELIMNSSSALLFGGNILLAFTFALPFILIHLVSNMGFALLLPKTKKIIMKKGGFDERKFISSAIDHISSSFGLRKNSKPAGKD